MIKKFILDNPRFEELLPYLENATVADLKSFSTSFGTTSDFVEIFPKGQRLLACVLRSNILVLDEENEWHLTHKSECLEDAIFPQHDEKYVKSERVNLIDDRWSAFDKSKTPVGKWCHDIQTLTSIKGATHIDLSNNRLTDESLPEIVDVLKHVSDVRALGEDVSSLRVIDLSGNRFSFESFSHLVQLLEMDTVHYVNVVNNSLASIESMDEFERLPIRLLLKLIWIPKSKLMNEDGSLTSGSRTASFDSRMASFGSWHISLGCRKYDRRLCDQIARFHVWFYESFRGRLEN